MAIKKVAVLEEFTWQQPIKDKDLSSPPESPTKGDRYIVATTGSGDWSGQTGNIAVYGTSSWSFIVKAEGMICWVEDENVYYEYSGTTWILLISIDNYDCKRFFRKFKSCR
jgi:hypothetical protein